MYKTPIYPLSSAGFSIHAIYIITQIYRMFQFNDLINKRRFEFAKHNLVS
jgi:hypothetical protein